MKIHQLVCLSNIAHPEGESCRHEKLRNMQKFGLISIKINRNFFNLVLAPDYLRTRLYSLVHGVGEGCGHL